MAGRKRTPKRIRVALVANEPGALQHAIQAIPGAELTVISPGEYAEEQTAAHTPNRHVCVAASLHPVAGGRAELQNREKQDFGERSFRSVICPRFLSWEVVVSGNGTWA